MQRMPGSFGLLSNFPHVLYFSGPWKNCTEMTPNGARSFFPTNLDLADFLGRTVFDFEHFDFLDFLRFQVPTFPGSQISRFPEIWLGPGLGRVGPGLGRAAPGCAGLGP